MKRFSASISIVALAAALTLSSCTVLSDLQASSSAVEEEQSAVSEVPVIPDTATPEGAITELFQGAKDWDIAAVESHLPDGVTIGSYVPRALEDSLNQVLNRMQYKVGDATVNGDTAVVAVEITTVDAKSALNDAVAKAVGYIAKQQLSGKQVDDYAELVEEVVGAIDIASLPSTTTSADAHLVMGGDGEWKLDLSDEKNMPLLNAATGGSIEMVDQIRSLAKTYGIDLGSLG